MMGLTLYKNGQCLFKRPLQEHWFKPGVKKLWDRLTMKIELRVLPLIKLRRFVHQIDLINQQIEQLNFRGKRRILWTVEEIRSLCYWE